MIMPPAGGPAMVGVIEETRGNGVTQTVSLATSSSVSGQNYFKVSYVGGGGPAHAPRQSYKPFGEAELRRETARAAPGVALARSSAFLRNVYGPFGYATGRSSKGDTCLFGWQQIRSGNSPDGAGRNFGMIQVRVRLCDDRASERELLSVMYGYSLTGSFQGQIWNPFGAPPSAKIGQPGEAIYPAAEGPVQPISFGYRPRSEGQAEGVARAPRRTAARAAPATTAAATPVAPIDLPPPGAPRVPLPDMASGPAAAPTGVQTSGSASVPASTVSGDGVAPEAGASVRVPIPD